LVSVPWSADFVVNKLLIFCSNQPDVYFWPLCVHLISIKMQTWLRLHNIEQKLLLLCTHVLNNSKRNFSIPPSNLVDNTISLKGKKKLLRYLLYTLLKIQIWVLFLFVKWLDKCVASTYERNELNFDRNLVFLMMHLFH
jgi:hypothetical protein